eukprot:3588981-Rhodomonas_salina.1
MLGNRAPSGREWDLQTGDRCGDGVLVGPGGMVPQSRPGLDTYGGQVTFCDDGNLESGADLVRMGIHRAQMRGNDSSLRA